MCLENKKLLQLIICHSVVHLVQDDDVGTGFRRCDAAAWRSRRRWRSIGCDGGGGFVTSSQYRLLQCCGLRRRRADIDAPFSFESIWLCCRCCCCHCRRRRRLKCSSCCPEDWIRSCGRGNSGSNRTLLIKQRFACLARRIDLPQITTSASAN